MERKTIIPIAVMIIVATVASGIYIFWNKQKNAADERTYPQAANYSFYPIHEIKQNQLSTGIYNTEGYVVKVYTCPPCPNDAQCKPCMRDNIVISEINQLREIYTLSDKEIILFADNPKQFKLGEKYQFSIKILDHKSTGEPINDVEIVGYSSLGDNTFGNSQVERAISDYLSDQQRLGFDSNEVTFNFCSVANLEPEDELFPLSLWAYCAKYTFENGAIKTLGGLSVPVKINYPNELSYYDYKKFSFEMPGDRSQYAVDVRKIFSAAVQEKIFNTDVRQQIVKALVAKNEAFAAKNIESWEQIKQAIANCRVKETFQAHSRQVSADLKAGGKITAIEPRLDEIMNLALAAEPKCGKIQMATE